jgi:hypothetical protein
VIVLESVDELLGSIEQGHPEEDRSIPKNNDVPPNPRLMLDHLHSLALAKLLAHAPAKPFTILETGFDR